MKKKVSNTWFTKYGIKQKDYDIKDISLRNEDIYKDLIPIIKNRLEMGCMKKFIAKELDISTYILNRLIEKKISTQIYGYKRREKRI